MADATLLKFVQQALGSGASRSDIQAALVDAGWSKDQIADALDAYSPIDFVIPVPVPKSHLSARDAFLYLLMFGMLYLCTYNLGNLLFQFVNLAFPDPAFVDYRQIAASRIRFSTSALLVAFPVFLFLSISIARQIHREPALRLSAVRKWLTYLTLAIAACIIVGNLIYLLNSLLSGELTVRFVLKVLIVGAISGGVFFYYLVEMRRDDQALAR